jgi:hypothetical protein
MNKYINKAIPLLSLVATLIFTSLTSYADNDEEANAKRRGPPPAAFDACVGKTAGDSAQFTSRRGKTLTGSCEELGGKDAGKLVLRPDNRPNKESGERRSPPPEAYTACEGKSAGESAEFKNRRGKTLKGTCEDENGKFVLRPERFKK